VNLLFDRDAVVSVKRCGAPKKFLPKARKSTNSKTEENTPVTQEYLDDLFQHPIFWQENVGKKVKFIAARIFLSFCCSGESSYGFSLETP
jgi:hypothetical protein